MEIFPNTTYLSGIEILTLLYIVIIGFVIIIIITILIYIWMYLRALMRPIKYPNQVPPQERHPKPYPPADQKLRYQKPYTQTYYCQYCGQPLRFEDRYGKWYCNECQKYF
jgi:hypothetical protein